MEPVRKLPRLQKALTFLLPDGWQGEVYDLSAVGMRIQSLVRIPERTQLEGALVLPDGQHIRLKGDVIWSTAPDHENRVPAELGMELLDAPESYLAALATLFAE